MLVGFISIDFRIYRRFVGEVDPTLGLLHFLAVDNVSDVSEIRAASIFKVEMSWAR
jgi:hypothetical protein